jgi:gamma-glutamyl-gamma-aminobutyraldehyde dehydrogenase
MHFQHLTYWQDKAKNSAIETRLFINGAYCDAADKPRLKPSTPLPVRRWRMWPGASRRT